MVIGKIAKAIVSHYDLPKDRKKLSKSEVEANEKEGLPSTDDGAELSASNRIVWNPDDFNTVPIFKEPVRF